MSAALFILGLAFGSFLDVVASRYDPDRFLLSRKVIGGRSACTKCGRTLQWFELIPLVSFLVQAGRCRTCRARLSFEYPTTEILSGLIFVFVPKVILPRLRPPGAGDYAEGALWIFVFLALLLIALIDFRTRIIPDETVIFIAILGILITALNAPSFGLIEGSFAGSYAALFGLRGNIWINHIAGMAFSALFFAFLIIVTRGRGMGGGDLKLAGALGLAFGWPDAALAVGAAFLLGSIAGVFQIAFRGKNLKSFLPFGPFLALGAAVIFFFGEDLLRFYFQLF